MENEVTRISTLVYYLYLFKNDLQFMHIHATGEDFDKIHQISEELYKEADQEIDELSEMAVSAGLKIDNLTNVRSYVAEEQWQEVTEEAVQWDFFTDMLSTKGIKLIDLIRDASSSETSSSIRSYLDELLQFWEKAIYYKNAARKMASSTSISVPDAPSADEIVEAAPYSYIDAEAEVEGEYEDDYPVDATSGYGEDINEAEDEYQEYLTDEEPVVDHMKTSEFFTSRTADDSVGIEKIS